MDTLPQQIADLPIDSLELLKGIPSEKHRAVLRCLDARLSHFDKGDLLADRDSTPTCTRYLTSGAALILRYDIEGNRSILGSYRNGSVIESDMSPQFRQANGLDIVATEPCTTFDFSISQKIEGCACCIKYINLIKGNLVQSLADTNLGFLKRLDTLAHRSTREKVLAFLREQSHEAGTRTFSIPYNRQELADYLYIERSALSRELGSMRHEGMISFERNVFCLTDD
ncbi:MAG: Crp/Fnr family transcriptional regulator [Gordonibacter sp.]|uniref:Crp/Fnr family transcriptional regulator n=1 Tax=Gordonibacter sp. TaxID=1968902 RepID=UPI002FC68E45